jgi:hypothetical protein
LYPVVGERTLRDLVAEAKANEQARRSRLRTVLTGAYSNYWRRMLPHLLTALTFHSNNTSYRPVMDAVDLLNRYAARPGRRGRVAFYDAAERVPLEGVVPAPWREVGVDSHGRVERVPYELCVLSALREAIRRREIWVAGAGRWRNPETDLPTDFDLNRDVHYAAIRQPTDATTFIDLLRGRLDVALAGLSRALAADTAGGVRVASRRGEVWIAVPRLLAQPEPASLEALKAEVKRRWGVIDLIDVLKEAEAMTGFTDTFTSLASREALPRDVLRRRILLVLFAVATNMGLTRMVAAGDGSETEAQLRRIRRLYVTRDNLRRAITAVVNHTLTVRDHGWWGTAPPARRTRRSSPRATPT